MDTSHYVKSNKKKARCPKCNNFSNNLQMRYTMSDDEKKQDTSLIKTSKDLEERVASAPTGHVSDEMIISLKSQLKWNI